MKQRLGIAQALLHQPKVLILDEPTNGLDPTGIRQLRDYLQHLAKDEGIAVLVSSHLLSEIELMCDRVVIIQNGQFVGEYSLKQQYKEQDALLVAFEVDQTARACEIINGTVQGHTVIVETTRDEIPELVRQLVVNDIRVYSAGVQNKSLEEEFLTLIEGARV
jgi:ABC-2 type transport system ATP-binding protein